MMRRPIRASLAIVVTLSGGFEASASTVNFQSFPRTPPLSFGQSNANVAGETVLIQDNIRMSVENFFLGSYVGFFNAEVGGRYDSFFPTTPLDLDNISVQFDFSNVGFPVTQVTLEYQEFGGADNFAVNNSTIVELPSLALLPTAIAPGVSASVDQGLIRLIGDISLVRIGGQELAIDNVIAIPEPSTLTLFALLMCYPLHRTRRRSRTFARSIIPR